MPDSASELQLDPVITVDVRGFDYSLQVGLRDPRLHPLEILQERLYLAGDCNKTLEELTRPSSKT